jgi:hypothetical protein
MFVLEADITECTCEHPSNCNHGCHERHCDSTEHACSIEFLPDDGGLTPWGCAECTPGSLMPHLEDCAGPVAMPARLVPQVTPLSF